MISEHSSCPEHKMYVYRMYGLGNFKFRAVRTNSLRIAAGITEKFCVSSGVHQGDINEAINAFDVHLPK